MNHLTLNATDIHLLIRVFDAFILMLKQTEKIPNKYNLLTSVEKFRKGLEGDKLFIDEGVCSCIGVSIVIGKNNKTLTDEEIKRLKEILRSMCEMSGISYADMNALMNGNRPRDTDSVF